MINICDWSQFKEKVISLSASIQFTEDNKSYACWIVEDTIVYKCKISKDDGSEQVDFETNYKSNGNKPIQHHDTDGKLFIRSESRPLNKTTCFTSVGDSSNNIGDGKDLCWDFSNSDDDITPSGVNYRKKRIEFSFIDAINIKDGSMYFNNAPKGCFLHLHVVCPSGSYYLDNNKNPVLASEDTIIDTFVNKHFIYGNCNMGDELNTEASSSEIPSHYKFWVDVTTPDSDSSSFGHVSLELYRSRTVIL